MPSSRCGRGSTSRTVSDCASTSTSAPDLHESALARRVDAVVLGDGQRLLRGVPLVGAAVGLRLLYTPGWRSGHYRRITPAGCKETLETGTMAIKDRGLRDYYPLDIPPCAAEGGFEVILVTP